jgi:prepilin signal peptidase PulO-like enzyme (type II secretory pathway)
MTLQPDTAVASLMPVDPPAPATRSALLPWLATWTILLCLAAICNAALILSTRQGFFIPLLATLLCSLAALFDGWTARIPNHLTYPAILLGLLLNALIPLLDRLHLTSALVWLHAPGLQLSLMGFAACAGLGLLGAALAGLHGGDLKLLAAIGALLGLTDTANALIVALAIALIYALINLIALGALNAVMRRAAMRLLELFYLRRFETPIEDAAFNPASHVPMAIPLALGLIVSHYWLLRTGGFIL